MSMPSVEHYGNVFVHKGGKLENRQFHAKMHQIAPNFVSNFKIFPGVIPLDPHPWGGGHPLPHRGPRFSEYTRESKVLIPTHSHVIIIIESYTEYNGKKIKNTKYKNTTKNA